MASGGEPWHGSFSASCDGEDQDEELSELLDSTLEDFGQYGKPAAVSAAGACAEVPAAVSAASACAVSAAGTAASTVSSGETAEKSKRHKLKDLEAAEEPDDDILRALLHGLTGDKLEDPKFLEEQLAALLQSDTLPAIFSPPTATGTAGAGISPSNFEDTLSETLESISRNAESLKADFSDDGLLKSFQESLDIGGSGGDNLIPMMQNMMHSLLSRDVLYPSLKDLADKYPTWLSQNNGKLEKAKLDNYARQFDIVTQLVDAYDSESSTDTQRQKDERFERILDLMSQMQAYGPPPKDITEQLAPGLNFDSEGNPQFPNMDQCSVM